MLLSMDSLTTRQAYVEHYSWNLQEINAPWWRICHEIFSLKIEDITKNAKCEEFDFKICQIPTIAPPPR